MSNFLDNVTPRPAVAICHDINHNGDHDPGRACGNPRCWKYDQATSPPPVQIFIPWCNCNLCARFRFEFNSLLRRAENLRIACDGNDA